MNAASLISDSIPPLKTSDSGERALNWMNEFHVKHLPIVNNEQLLGVISEDDILEQPDPEEPLGSFQLSNLRPYVFETDHLYAVLKAAAEMQLTVVPVVDSDMKYLGMVTLQSLVNHFAHAASVTEPGGIIVLEINVRDYSVAEIARIVESTNTNILSLYTLPHPDSTKMEVVLKLNRTNLSDLIAAFERFEYHIAGFYEKADNNDYLKDRYDSFIKYLNI